jgi:hypothetical protein
MRRCLAGDILAAARVVAAADPARRKPLAQSLIAEAAHRYAKRKGRAHPLWGNGSLMSRALLLPPRPQINQQSADFLTALALIAQLLAQRKAARHAISTAL